MFPRWHSTGFASVLALAYILTACGTDATPTGTPAETMSSAPEPTPDPTTSQPSPLDELIANGYPVSDEYVVETVVRDLDAGTGGLAIDDDGYFYQADFGYPGHPGRSVYRVSPDGGQVEEFASSEEMDALTMTVFGPDGTLYQSSYRTDKVFAIDDDGNPEVVADGILGPTGIVVLEDGTLLVEAYDGSVMHEVSPDGTVSEWTRSSEFRGVNGLTMGPDGTLYAANHREGGLLVIDEAGEVTRLHTFPAPTSHVVYHDGALFVTSRGSFVVFRYDLETEDIEIVAGNGEPGFSDGRGTEASFGSPNAITVGPDGELYFNHADGEGVMTVHIRRLAHRP